MIFLKWSFQNNKIRRYKKIYLNIFLLKQFSLILLSFMRLECFWEISLTWQNVNHPFYWMILLWLRNFPQNYISQKIFPMHVKIQFTLTYLMLLFLFPYASWFYFKFIHQWSASNNQINVNFINVYCFKIGVKKQEKFCAKNC